MPTYEITYIPYSWDFQRDSAYCQCDGAPLRWMLRHSRNLPLFQFLFHLPLRCHLFSAAGKLLASSESLAEDAEIYMFTHAAGSVKVYWKKAEQTPLKIPQSVIYILSQSIVCSDWKNTRSPVKKPEVFLLSLFRPGNKLRKALQRQKQVLSNGIWRNICTAAGPNSPTPKLLLKTNTKTRRFSFLSKAVKK